MNGSILHPSWRGVCPRCGAETHLEAMELPLLVVTMTRLEWRADMTWACPCGQRADAPASWFDVHEFGRQGRPVSHSVQNFLDDQAAEDEVGKFRRVLDADQGEAVEALRASIDWE